VRLLGGPGGAPLAAATHGEISEHVRTVFFASQLDARPAVRGRGLHVKRGPASKWAKYKLVVGPGAVRLHGRRGLKATRKGRHGAGATGHTHSVGGEGEHRHCGAEEQGAAAFHFGLHELAMVRAAPAHLRGRGTFHRNPALRGVFPPARRVADVPVFRGSGRAGQGHYEKRGSKNPGRLVLQAAAGVDVVVRQYSRLRIEARREAPTAGLAAADARRRRYAGAHRRDPRDHAGREKRGRRRAHAPPPPRWHRCG
jgi:hypothetical protein